MPPSSRALPNEAGRWLGDGAPGAGISIGSPRHSGTREQKAARRSYPARLIRAATTLGGTFHSLPFAITDVDHSMAGVVVAIELFLIASVRYRLQVTLRSSLIEVTLGGAIVLPIGVATGSA